MIKAELFGIRDKKYAEELLELVGLVHAGRKKTKHFSLGMKQRLGIASAIMEMPDLVILDEPTNALDANGVEITKKIIAEEKERSALVIITCHDQEILEDVCDVIYTIEHGKITNEKIMQAEANSE